MAGGERSRKFYEERVEDLIAFAEHEFRNARKLDDGASEGDHRRSAAEQWAKLGKPHLAVEVLPPAPPLPIELNYLWRFFIEISMGLASNGMGSSLVTWESLAAWSAFMRIDVEPWEALALVRIGYARAVVEGEKTNKNTKPPGGK